ncbi:hypothetical protein [Sinorhizobium fredii]|uniref:hypothetical protein n=1 Tax=Rhizobium fredii TaxID=380 RepID=UPI0009B7154A|nr:hypothetical protein [Sinorhizobium fredii]WOS66030.1 hypothetical protein SFGR64A_20085 [Sinorhizobium fredii GR64]
MGQLMNADPVADPIAELNLRILKLERRLQRERTARLQAEAIAEQGLSDLYEKQRQLELLKAIATKANQGASVDDTLRFAVEAICSHTGCQVGHVYMLAAEDTQQLLPAPIWHGGIPIDWPSLSRRPSE